VFRICQNRRIVKDLSAKLFVLAAPSGAGKTTLVHALTTKHPVLRFSISYTTRRKRHNEADGVDYIFVDTEEFERLRPLFEGNAVEHDIDSSAA